MGRLRAAGRPDRGGDGVQALRAARVRVATAAASLVAVGGLGVYAVSPAAPELRALIALPAIGAVLLLAGALVSGWSAPVPWALAACLGAYAAGLLAAGQGLDPLAPLFAAGLLVAAELAYWSLEERVVPEAREALARRVAVVAALAAGTAGLGSVVLTAALVRPAGGPLVLAVGVAAAIAVSALLARFAHAPGR